MKTSTEIGSISKIVGEEKAVEFVARAGFDAWDFSMFDMCKYDGRIGKLILPNEHPLANGDYAKFARKLRKIGEDNGIKCNQSHAPFPTSSVEIRSYLKRAIECTALAGGEICVIHPQNNCSASENAQWYLELLPFAKECGVKIATENMWNWDNEKNQACFAACSTVEDFKAHIDIINDENFVACVDIGHAEMKGLNTSAVEMIKCLGNRVKALHIHDNDKWHDSHQIPFSMNVEFEPIIKALKEIGYDGYFTLETDIFSNQRQLTAEDVFDGVKEMSAVARKMANYFDSL